MYLIPICVPVFLRGPRRLVSSDWKRGLELLRDSLGGRYGELLVLSPSLPAESPRGREQCLTELDPDGGISVEPVYDEQMRARQFWSRASGPYRRRLRELLPEAEVVHAGLDDLHRPMMGIAFSMAVRAGIPTVFVQDTDEVIQVRDLARGFGQRLRAEVYVRLYERICRRSVAQADLSLLKGDALMARYARFARNARQIENTSYRSEEIVPASKVEARLLSLRARRPLRLVYAGRLVARKGLADSIEIVSRARAMGADLELDLIGGGPDEAMLRERIETAGLQSSVRIQEARPYSAAFLASLAEYDAILFTPTAEDTPRMIFDGYAAGLPLIATSIPYVAQRARAERSTVLLPRADNAGAAHALAELDSNRNTLVELTRSAHRAAELHSAQSWFTRRAEWTHEAVERRRARGATPRAQAAAGGPSSGK